MKRTELVERFTNEKAKLNAEQRQAIETIEGPVMVLAGPGTGKTQVIAFRVAEILEKTDVSPRNILALTFTESGVVAMRQRLVSLIGVTAYAVNIYTFHGFANRVINDAGAEFYKTHSLDPIDEITQLKLVMHLVDKLDNPLLRPMRAPYWYVKPIMHAIKSIKNEGVSPDLLRELTNESIANLQNDGSSISKSGKTKGELKQSVKDKIKQYERTLALADLFEAYEIELAERGFYDYEDMILFVVKSFRENPNLKAKYQEQFQYILVDEYQDTNNAQNTLVRILSDYFENPNLFVVGDDKQSIYRFQGASMANLLNFLQWYPSAKLISLKQNYRSGQPILDNAQSLINQNTEQLSKVLTIHTDLSAQHTESNVTFLPYPSFDIEAIGVIGKIKELLNQGAAASEIALIYRENREAATFTDLLTRHGIAYHIESGSNVLDDPDVMQLINLLELAREPDNDIALFKYLHAPYSGTETTDLIQLSRHRKQARTTWAALLEATDPPAEITLKDWELVRSVKERINEWHRYQTQHNLGDIAEHIFLTSGLLAFVMNQPDHLQRLHRIRCFYEEISHIMTSVPYASLQDLFDVLTIRQTYNLPLTCLPLTERSDDAIRLMTAHKSKGLEFDYVFIPHFYDGLWCNSSRSDLISLPEGMVPHHQVSDEQKTEEDRRLFYVALTRAKKAVYISCPDTDSSNKRLIPCQFLEELSDVTVETPKVAEQQKGIVDFFSPVDTQFVEATSKAYLQEIVANQPITPTGLNTFLVCPQEYLYKSVYCIPGVREPYQAYGTAIHKALELWGDWSTGKRDGYTISDVLSVFDEALLKEGLLEHEIKKFQELGHTVLSNYFTFMQDKWIPPLVTEYNFEPHHVMLDGKVPITGKLDKIEPIKGSTLVRVVDYKTGRVRSRNDIEGKTASSDGDYKRQLVFYSLLAESDPAFAYKVGEVALAFIDDDGKFTTEVFDITRQEKDELKQLIRSVYQEIISLHFDHTPHKRRFGSEEGISLCDLLRYGR